MRREPLATRSTRAILSDKTILRYTLAHHPTCSVFAPDLVKLPIGKRKVPLCTGCLAFWPSLLGGLPLVLNLSVHAGASWWSLATIGFAMAAPQLLSYMGLVRSRSAKLLVKAAFGLGAASVIASLILAPWPVALRVGTGLALAFMTAAVHTLRLKRLQHTCDTCPWQRDWQHCPGFAPINDHRPRSTPTHWSDDPDDLPQAWPWSPPHRRP